MIVNIPTRMSKKVSPLRHVRDIAARGSGKDSIAYETYCALPSPPRPYSSYDYAIVAEIIQAAEGAVAKAYKKGEGSGLVTLQAILQAYELILPRHGVKPDDDTYYYRLLLKLSLDQEDDWWAKLRREAGSQAGQLAFLADSVSTVSTSTKSLPRSHDLRPPSSYLTSTTRTAGASRAGTSFSSAASATPSLRRTAPTIGGGQIPSPLSPPRISAPNVDLQDAGRGAPGAACQAWQGLLRASQEATAREAAITAAAREKATQAARAAASQLAAAQAERAALVVREGAAGAREAAVQEALIAAREVIWDTPLGAAAREDLAEAARTAAEEAAARAAAAREAIEAAKESTMQAARDAAARESAFRDAAARDAAAREVAERETSWEAAREAVLLGTAAQRAVARVDTASEAVTARREAMRLAAAGAAGQQPTKQRSSGPFSSIPKPGAASAASRARGAPHDLAAESTAQATAAAMAAGAAVDAARVAVQGRFQILQQFPVGPPSAGLLTRSSEHTSGLPAESMDGGSDMLYAARSKLDGISNPYTGDEAADALEGGAAVSSSHYGPAMSTGTAAVGSSRARSGLRIDGSLSPQSGARRLVADVYMGSAQRRASAPSLALDTPRSSRGDASDLFSNNPGCSVGGHSLDPGAKSRTGEMSYSVSRFIAGTDAGAPSTMGPSSIRSTPSVQVSAGTPSTRGLLSTVGAPSTRGAPSTAGAPSTRGPPSTVDGDDGFSVLADVASVHSASTATATTYHSCSGLSGHVHSAGRGISPSLGTRGETNMSAPSSQGRSSGYGTRARSAGEATSLRGAGPFSVRIPSSSHSTSGLVAPATRPFSASVSEDERFTVSTRAGSTVSAPAGRGAGSGVSSSALADVGYSAGAVGDSGFSASARGSGASMSAASASFGSRTGNGGVGGTPKCPSAISIGDRTISDDGRSPHIYQGSGVPGRGPASAHNSGYPTGSVSTVSYDDVGAVRGGSASSGFTASTRGGLVGDGAGSCVPRDAYGACVGNSGASAIDSEASGLRAASHAQSVISEVQPVPRGGAFGAGGLSREGSFSFRSSTVAGPGSYTGSEAGRSFGGHTDGGSSYAKSQGNASAYAADDPSGSSFGYIHSGGSTSQVGVSVYQAGGSIVQTGADGFQGVGGEGSVSRGSTREGSAMSGGLGSRSRVPSMHSEGHGSTNMSAYGSAIGTRDMAPGSEYAVSVRGEGSLSASLHGGSNISSGIGPGGSLAYSYSAPVETRVNDGQRAVPTQPGSASGGFHSLGPRPASCTASIPPVTRAGVPYPGRMGTGMPSRPMGGSAAPISGITQQHGAYGDSTGYDIGTGGRGSDFGDASAICGSADGPFARAASGSGSGGPFSGVGGADGSVQCGFSAHASPERRSAPTGFSGAEGAFPFTPPRDSGSGTSIGLGGFLPGGRVVTSFPVAMGFGLGSRRGVVLEPQRMLGPAEHPAAQRGAGDEDDSDEDSVLREETQAYLDFSRMARVFRTWRRNAFTRQASRSERDLALHNWAVATSFWAIQLLRRCFNRWRELAPRKAVMAVAIWGDHSRAGCFRRWLVFTRYLRSKSTQCERMWCIRQLKRCLRGWRQYVVARQRKAATVAKALGFWTDWTLRGCWRLWRAFTAAKRREALAAAKAVQHWSDKQHRACWSAWRLFTANKHRRTLVLRKAVDFWCGRWLRACWLQWRAYTEAKHLKTLAAGKAVDFWRARCLRACWREWRQFAAYKRRKVELIRLALEFLMGSSLRGCWRHWRDYTARRQRKAQLAVKAMDFWMGRTARGCLRWWRQYTVRRQRKALLAEKAILMWTGRTLHGCFAFWRQFAEDQQRMANAEAKALFFWRSRTLGGCVAEWRALVEEAKANWELSGHVYQQRVFLAWQVQARYLAKLSRAYSAITTADQRRLLLMSFQVLADAFVSRHETSRRLLAALSRRRRRRLQHAFTSWRTALQLMQYKHERQAQALAWRSARCLARSWRAWHQALVHSCEALEAARRHALKALRPLLRDVFYAWMDWHEDKMLRRTRNEEARRIMESRRKKLMLRAWRATVVENRQLVQSFQRIMRHEVQRLLGQAFRRMRLEHDSMRRAVDTRAVLQHSAAQRCFQHWKELGKARTSRAEWRAQQLHHAASQRTRRLLVAWHLVVRLHAEQEQLVRACIARRHGLQALSVLRAWRGRVLRYIGKRVMIATAVLAWMKGMKSRAWCSWRLLLKISHANASRFAMAARHHRTRRISLCFRALATEWRTYQMLLERALMYRAVHIAVRQAEVLEAWRQMVGVLRWKNVRMRRALEYCRNRRLAGSLYGWYYITRHRLATKQAIAVAVMHWVQRRRAAAFVWWREWTAYSREQSARYTQYSRVRAMRIKEWCIMALRANVIRNACMRGAIVHHHRYMARLALSGWLLRTLLAAEWANRLREVTRQLTRQLLVTALEAWLEYLAYRRDKSCMAKTALHYWRLGRQRSALDCMRWNATRRQIMRAAVQRGRQYAAVRVLRAWRKEAVYRRRLRDRFTLLVAHNRRTALKRGFSVWQAYLHYRVAREQLYNIAAGHSVRRTTSRAFRSWRAYHSHLRRASERARDIAQRWRKRDAAEVLAAFSENVVYCRKMCAAEALFGRRLAALAFAAWREFLVIKQALDFWGRNRLTETLAAWRQYALWRKGLRAVGDLLAMRWRSLIALQVLSAWRNITVAQKRLMEIGQLLAARTNRSALAAMFACWRVYAARSARLQRIYIEVAGRVCCRLISHFLAAWHLTAQRHASLKRTGAFLAARCQRAVLAGAFSFWCSYAARSTRLRQVAEQVAARLRHAKLSSAFCVWCSYAARATRLHSTGAVLSSRLRRNTLASAFGAWCSYTGYKANLHATAEMALANRQLRTLAGLLGAWRACTWYRGHLKRTAAELITRRNLQTACAIFSSWLSYASYKAHLHSAMLTVASRTLMAQLRGVLEAWRCYAGRKAHLDRATVQLIARSRQACLSGCFTTWHSRAAYRAHLASAAVRVSGRLQRGIMAHVLGSWHVYAAYKAHLRKTGEFIASRQRCAVLGDVLAVWRSYARHMAALKNLLERVLVRVTALAFFGWRECVWESKQWLAVQENIRQRVAINTVLKETAFYAATRLRKWPLSMAFYTWYDNAVEIRYMRDKATKAVFSYAGSLMRKALAAWLAYTLRHRHLRQKLSRCQATAREKTRRVVLQQWHQVACYLRRLGLAATRVMSTAQVRLLRSAFASWQHTTVLWIQLKSILARIMARQLSTVWASWREEVLNGKARVQAAQAISARWLHRSLSNAFFAWRLLVVQNRAAWRLALRCRRRLTLRILACWQEAVFEAGVERGGELHERRVTRRALRGWHATAADARRGRELKAVMQQRLARSAFDEWRRQWLACAAYRRLYCRRALLGWHERTQALRQARARLWHATRYIMYSSMSRCFSTWWQYTQAMAIKRAVFIRKQRALAEALRRGDELAARRNAELQELAFRGWQHRAVILKRVHRRMAVHRARTLTAVLAEWRQYARIHRERAANQRAVVRRRLLERPLHAWQRAAALATAKAADADAHRRTTLLDAALAAWKVHHEAIRLRREALRTALEAGAAAATAALKARAWEAWCECWSRRGLRMEAVELAAGRRRLRALGLAFDVWLKYTKAMRSGGIDPGSPYLSPRDGDADRWLVTRMAALAGNEQALSGPDLSLSTDLLDGLYPSTALKQALERRQEVTAFLSAMRASSGAGLGGVGGRSAAFMPASAAAAMRSHAAAAAAVERQRQRERRDSHGSAAGGSSLGSASVSTVLSSGAGGADLAELALQVVRATPGLTPSGKSRAHAKQHAAATAAGRAGGPVSPDLGGSPFDDRLDLRALYDITGPNSRAAAVAGMIPTQGPSGPFGGFAAGQAASGSPAPLPRPLTPRTASGPIAPRRIDFTSGRNTADGRALPEAARPVSSYYGYVTPSRGPPQSLLLQQGGLLGQQSQVGPLGVLQRHGQLTLGMGAAPGATGPGLDSKDADSDAASTTSIDLSGPLEARARAAAAAAEPSALSWQGSFAFGRSPAGSLAGAGGGKGGGSLATGDGTGNRTKHLHHHHQQQQVGMTPSGRVGVVFMGGPLARQARGVPAQGPAVGGLSLAGVGGMLMNRGSILDSRNRGGR